MCRTLFKRFFSTHFSLLPSLKLKKPININKKGHRASDIYFVPISLTYERLLEESLYANELLGIPKPKESVKGLFKARSILNECYGTIFVNFARPISLKEAFLRVEMISTPSIEAERSLVNLTPGFIFELSPRQTKSLESLSYYFLIEMLRNQIIQPISIISTCLLLSMVLYYCALPCLK